MSQKNDVNVSMSIGFTLTLSEADIAAMDECAGEDRGREWGDELLANFGTTVLENCIVNDCEVEIVNK